MLISAKALKGFKLESLDGKIGAFKDFYFDDEHWLIRYLAVATGNWLLGKQVLLSPHALLDVPGYKRSVVINLTKKQIEASPSPEKDNVITWQFEQDYYAYYDWPAYSSETRFFGESGSPREANLRNTDTVRGYEIQAGDGKVGHVEDFIIDTSQWRIRYLVVDTRDWWPGQKVLISPAWIERISWSDATVFVNVLRAAIETAPEYDEKKLLTRRHELSLHRYYERVGYWEESDKLEKKTEDRFSNHSIPRETPRDRRCIEPQNR